MIPNPPVQHQVETLLRARDIARRLAISRSAAYRLMRETIPVVRIAPGILRVRESDLEEFITSRNDNHQDS